MFRLTPKDKRIIKEFLLKNKVHLSSKKLYSNGSRLDGLWMGGNCIAYWDRSGNYILLRELGSKASLIVQRFIRKLSKIEGYGIVIPEDEIREIKRRKKLELRTVLSLYYMSRGKKKIPAEWYLEDCWNLGMIDDEIRRIEEYLYE